MIRWNPWGDVTAISQAPCSSYLIFIQAIETSAFDSSVQSVPTIRLEYYYSGYARVQAIDRLHICPAGLCFHAEGGRHNETPPWPLCVGLNVTGGPREHDL